MRGSRCVIGFSCALVVACGRVGYDPADAFAGGSIDAPGLDAAGLDAAGLDAAGLDAAMLDAPGLDAFAEDAFTELLDAPGLDAPMPDAVMPDAVMPDAVMPDAAMPDAALPDAALPDATSVGSDAAVAMGSIDPRCAAEPLTRYSDIGTGSPGDPYILCNGDQLDSFLASGPVTSFYMLGQDISTPSWSGRASFLGTLDGNGHVLRVTSFTNEPLFANLSGTVQHLRLVANVDASFLDRAGAVAGTASGTVSDVHLTADFVTGQDETGGLVGQCNACTVDFVSVTVARVSGQRMVGGVIGNMFTGRLSRARVVITQLDSRATTGCAQLGGIAGSAHDGAQIDEAHANVGIALNATGAGGIVGDLGLGSQVRDVIAEGSVVYLGGSSCTTGAGGLVGTLSGSMQRGWARLSRATAGLADRVQLGGQLVDVAGITPGLGAPEWTLRSCALGSSITNVAVLDDGFAGSGDATCAFMAPRTTMVPAYFFLPMNAPMSSWDRATIWSFADSAMPTLARLPP